ncbi:MAG: ornithine carbamoyltransferase [Fibrobacterota bacterium]
MKKDFLSLENYSSSEISEVLNRARSLKKNRFSPQHNAVFGGRTAVLIFDKPSLRTKITFETGIYELGGNPLSMSPAAGRLGERESIHDMAKNLERWVHLLVVRTFSHSAVEELAREARIPVINALTDDFHPCQSIAMGLTVDEHFAGEKISITYIGDGNNVCASHVLYALKTGHSITVCTPKGFELPPRIVAEADKAGRTTGGRLYQTNNPEDAVKRANLIYTDVWASMGQEEEQEERARIFAPYQINTPLMKKAPASALFSHCLPAHRGDEVTAEVMDGDQSIVFDEAENRLHAHKGIIQFLADRSR